MAFFFLNMCSRKLPNAVRQCGFLDSLSPGLWSAFEAVCVCWQKLPDVAVVKDPFNHWREGSKGCIQFVACMVITVLKVKYSHY